MTDVAFPEQTLESAPPESQRMIKATAAHLGYLPVALARMAGSPQLMDGFLKTSGLFESSTLDPLARETLVMIMAVRNGCHICVAMHTAALTRLGADAGLIAGLRAGRPVADERLAGAAGLHARGAGDRGRGRRRAAGRVLQAGVHPAQRAGGRAGNRGLHDVDPGQPDDPVAGR